MTTITIRGIYEYFIYLALFFHKRDYLFKDIYNIIRNVPHKDIMNMNTNNEHKILLFFKLLLIILTVKTRQRIRIILPFIILLLKIYKEDPIKLIVE